MFLAVSQGAHWSRKCALGHEVTRDCSSCSDMEQQALVQPPRCRTKESTVKEEKGVLISC